MVARSPYQKASAAKAKKRRTLTRQERKQDGKESTRNSLQRLHSRLTAYAPHASAQGEVGPFPQPLHNRFSTATQLRANHNHDSTILRVEPKNDSNTTIPHPRSLNRQHRAAWPWLVHQLPWPSRYFLHHPRREGDRQAAGNGVISVFHRPQVHGIMI